MEEKSRHKLFTDGTSQADRFPRALKDGYILADEMRFEDLLAMGADYAKILKFYDLSNNADENWGTFFTSDALVIFAKIMATDLKKIEAEFFDVFLEAPDHKKYRLTKIPNYQLAIDIDSWLRSVRSIDSSAGQKLYAVIKGVIEKKLKRQLYLLEQFFPDKSFIKEEFDRIWSTPEPSQASTGSDDKHFLNSNFAAFYNAVLLIQETARKLTPEARESQIHNPAIGMYVAFINLFDKVQRKINCFTERHLDFYYRKVLKIQPRDILPDRAFLAFDTDTENREVLIKSVTEFVAGTDANNIDVIYTADNDLLVYSTRVESLRTLCLERNQLISPENQLEYVTGAKVNQIPAQKGIDVADNQKAHSWPVFGAPKSAGQRRVYDDASLGFAIASSILFLKEGQRDISITFKFQLPGPEGKPVFVDLIEKVIEILNKKIKLGSMEKPEANAWREDYFYKIFRRMFTIELTAATGWYTVENYLPLSNLDVDEHKAAHKHESPAQQDAEDSIGKNEFKIKIYLSPRDEAIVSYSAEIHGDGFDTDLPIIRFTMNPMAFIYPYTLLKGLNITGIDIDVDVKGVNDVVVHNNLGQLDPISPFNPFGPLPINGSHLIIGSREAAGKHLTHFDVDVEWAALPVEKGGFEDYYRAYEMGFNNDVFEVGLSVLNGGQWLPRADREQPRLTLFKSDADGICTSRRLSCRRVVNLIKTAEDSIAPVEFSYDSSRKDGFFKFTLTAPLHAFGHRDYPLKLSSVLTENAKLKKLKLHKPVPNPPYTPQISKLSVNYRANVRANFERIGSAEELRRRGRVFHIHPFGVERLSRQTHSQMTMVPQYESDGNLFIGLSPPVLSGALTLLFHLRDDSSLKSDADPPALKWFFLSANRWEPIDDRHVLSDTTRGFLSSGIVTLMIPPHEPAESSSMPGHLFWLRVSLDKHPEIPCSVYSINTQALQVTWQKRNDSSAHMETILPAGTIKDSRISIPGIGQITQVADSFGGRKAEDEIKFKTRVSERLRHKNRATVPWDFERLILNQFPKIYKVKCFSNMVDDSQRRQRPGHILIVVIPFLKDASAANMEPMVHGVLLKKIKAYVENLSSPVVKIKVRNAAYEKIQVRCKVRFSRDGARGYYLKKLNQDLVNYLSPWNKIGYSANFGWCIRRHDLQSYVRKRDYINFVTDFSLLRVAKDDNQEYSLFDTAAPEVRKIHPLFPWSIAIPFKQHFLEAIDKEDDFKPTKTGINELEIGSNFIIP